MKVICCGCGTSLSDKPSTVNDEDAVSHGLCGPCGLNFVAQMGLPLDEYLESLDVPVVTVTADGIIGAGNELVVELLGKSSADINGLPGGDVFECQNARLPGGCGRTIHCSGCTVRNTVMETARTGKARRNVPAYLDQGVDGVSRMAELLISTEMKGGVILLRIERMIVA